jgi:hypothetical protein
LDDEEDDEGFHMCASSIAQHFFAKYTLGRQITNLSSLSKFIHKKSSCFSETCERPHMGEEKVGRRRGAIG